MKKGYQLFSAWKRCLDPAGLKELIRHIGALGYDGVEFFTYSGVPAADMKELLAQSGLKPINAHVQLDRWRANAAGEIAYAKAIGMDTLTIPFLAPEERGGEGLAALCREIPLWGKMCRDHGVTLCYHNHDFEFVRTDGVLLLDRLLEADPAMRLELDAFWCYFAGAEPVETMERYAGRLALLHVKDYADLTAKPAPAFTALGTGKMEYAPIVKKARSMGIEWLVNEQDNSAIDELESAALSLRALKDWCV